MTDNTDLNEIRKQHNDFCKKHQAMSSVLFDRTIGVPVLLDTIRRACDKIDDLREQVTAADTLVTELTEACQQALVWVEGDEATHGRQFGTGNTLRAVLACKTQGDAK